jgi:hypothetical protein
LKKIDNKKKRKMKSVFIYKLCNEYLCLEVFQNHSNYLGLLSIPEEIKKISFGHIKFATNDIVNNKFVLEDKDDFLNKYRDKIYNDCIEMEKFKNLEKEKQDEFHISVSNKNSIYNDSKIHLILPSEHISNEQYIYIESLPIQDLIITYPALYDKINNLEREKRGIQVKVIKLKVCVDFHQFMRNDLDRSVIKEYYFPELNTCLNTEKNINVFISPRDRYIGKIENVRTFELSFNEADEFYKVIKAKAQIEISNIYDTLRKLDNAENDNFNDYRSNNNIDYKRIPLFAEPYLTVINKSCCPLEDNFLPENNKFLTHFLSHYTRDERFYNRVQGQYLIFNHDKVYLRVSDRKDPKFINIKIEGDGIINYFEKIVKVEHLEELSILGL